MSALLAIDETQDQRLPRGLGGVFYGVYPAVVTDLKDPAGRGRVKVKLPWSPDRAGAYEAWARVATMMAGNDRGSWFIPDRDDEVLIAFAGGDPRWPYVIGALWNGVDKTPQEMDGNGRNDVKKLRSRNGVMITIDDTRGQEKLVLETPGGHKVTLEDGGAKIEIVDSNQNTVTLNSSGVSVQSSGAVRVQASSVTVTAGSVSVDTAMATFSGVVQAQTFLATTVSGATYTPGAGNIW